MLYFALLIIMKTQYLLNLTDMKSETGLKEDTLKKLISNNIIYTAQSSPVILFFSRDIKKIRMIKGMIDMGYKFKDIKRIIREIGIPGDDDSKKKDKLYQIGEFCKKYTLNPRQIKYWEQMGLFYPASRSKGGIRLYNESLLRHLRFIQHLQEIGFRLDEIKKIIDNIDVEIVEKRINHISEIIRGLKPLLKNMKAMK